MPKILATYQSNYNGWDGEVDGVPHDFFAEHLPTITHDGCDDAGEYEYGNQLKPAHHDAVVKLIESEFGECEITIEMDEWST